MLQNARVIALTVFEFLRENQQGAGGRGGGGVKLPTTQIRVNTFFIHGVLRVRLPHLEAIPPTWISPPSARLLQIPAYHIIKEFHSQNKSKNKIPGIQ